ncbi:NADH-quinone oxidoreductase subunit M [Geomonas sp. RF6]|uniref:complex I subunit 4 family protein n=1 Tax=Geomonas sp. RF6 TaxID=2897342 RepID=UPI001E5E6452|nr:NADH-quinone oxidoreductase subunit M [Geomonas sp. RF6]UFS72582.1 NADH-quinone oxidoreductase subunit M [Geomonas sp. RF6]
MFNATTVMLLVAIPALAGVLTALVPGKDSSAPRALALLSMLGVLALAGGIFLDFGAATDPAIYDMNLEWVPSLGINFHFGLDGINLYLVFVTALIFPVIMACAWGTKEAKDKLYVSLILFIQASLFGTFLSQNLMLFFAFWELVLIPMYILILAYGGEKRRTAANTFFLYTMAGSILLLAGIILLGVQALHQTGAWSFDYATLYTLHLDYNTQVFFFLAVLLACLVKCPVFPFHSWLPLAYNEAPASGTAIMAGAMSKMGAFGLLKLAIPLAPEVSAAAAPYVMMIAVVSIVYGAVLALKQEDFKKLIAYSSLSHMGYIVLGIFALQQAAIHGALFQILSHGAAVAGLFLILGLLEQRKGAAYLKISALSTTSPRLAVTLMLFIVASVALPLTSGFTSEFLILFGGFQKGVAAWQSSPLILISVLIACSGMVLGAGYMLRFARAILFGKTNESSLEDLNPREAIAFLPLLVLILWVGINPAPIMEKAQGAVNQLQAQTTSPAALPVAAVNIMPGNGGTNGQ